MKQWKVFGILGALVILQPVYAMEQEEENGFEFHPVVTLSGGAALNSDAGASTDFSIGYSELDYDADNTTQVRGVFGGFLGGEFSVDEEWALQLGLSYYQTGTYGVEGTLAQGFNPASTAEYAYDYKIVARQALIEGKLLREWKEIYHPYISLGLGAAFNTAEDYEINYPAELAMAPEYGDHTTTSFTYNIGLGVDVDLSEHIRLGLGYRFTDFGKVRLDEGVYDQFDPTTISQSLEQSHFYVNELLAQFTYLM